MFCPPKVALQLKKETTKNLSGQLELYRRKYLPVTKRCCNLICGIYLIKWSQKFLLLKVFTVYSLVHIDRKTLKNISRDILMIQLLTLSRSNNFRIRHLTLVMTSLQQTNDYSLGKQVASHKLRGFSLLLKIFYKLRAAKLR